MRAWSVFRLLLLSAACMFLCSPVLHAQLPRRIERCLPYPTLAEEFEDMREEIAAKRAKMENTVPGDAKPEPRVVIEQIRFFPPIDLPESTQIELFQSLQKAEFHSSSNWLEEIQEIPIRGAWQNNGYFKIKSSAEAHLVDGDLTHLYYSVDVYVDEGYQYRLGEVTFRSADPDERLVFSEDELRKYIYLNHGNILSAEKIRKSLDALKRFYGTNGYIDFTATPFTEVGDSTKTIDIRMDLDQQRQFRIGTVTVFGSTPEFEGLLKTKFQPGDIFDWDKFEAFFSENKAMLPPDASPWNQEIKRSHARGTVDFRLDFRGCPDPEAKSALEAPEVVPLR